MGIAELFIIALVTLFVFGPERLPELFKKFREFNTYWQNFSDEINRQVNNTIYQQELKDKQDAEPAATSDNIEVENEARK